MCGRRAKSKWAKGSSSTAQATSASAAANGRIIVFIAGGMTYAEMRTVYDIDSRAIYIGTRFGQRMEVTGGRPGCLTLAHTRGTRGRGGCGHLA